jgi:hypothetical protein
MNKHHDHTNTASLGAPHDWDQVQLPCDALPITCIEYSMLGKYKSASVAA